MYTYRILNIHTPPQSDYERFYAMMSPEKQRRVERFHFDDDKKRTVYGEMLARQMLAQYCSATPEAFVFAVAAGGKPYAENTAAQFNISHSGDLVLCAVGDRPLGVDIEKMRAADDKLMRYACTDEELAYVLSAPDEAEKNRRFFGIWTAKEAYFKCLGTGVTGLKSVSVFNDALTRGMQQFYEDDYAVAVYEDAGK